MQYEERDTTSPSDRKGRLSVSKDLGAVGEAQTGNDNECVSPVGARQRFLSRTLRHADF